MTTKEALLALINRANATSYTIDQLNFSVASTQADPAIKSNTKVVINAVDQQLQPGRATLYYDRLDLTAFVGSGATRFEIITPTSSTHLLTAFNARFKTFLTTADIVTEALPAVNADGEIKYVLKANAGSYGFIGQLPVTIVPLPAPAIP